MMRRVALFGAALIVVAPMCACGTGIAGASTAHATVLRAGHVSPADVGAPAGSKPIAPALSVVPPVSESSTLAGPVLPFGGAVSYGSLSGVQLNKPIVGMAATPTGHGYWLVASDGGIFSFGDAHFHGSMGGTRLNAPVVGMAASPTGNGYWLVATDGGIFTFGDAHFHGSTGNLRLNAPVVGMAASPTGNGYWLVATDGGIFTFGDAHFHGSTGNLHLVRPVIGMARDATGGGYWLVATDGGIFTFGDAHYYGSGGGMHLAEPVVGMAATPTANGYWLVEQSPPTVFSPSLVASLNGRAGVISADVLDLASGISYQYRPGQLSITASIVKVQILGTLLQRAQAANRSLTSSEMSTATAMIEDSDNDAATALWNEVGGAPSVHAFDQQVGLTATTPNVDWGLTTTDPTDQVTLLNHLVHSNSVLSDSSRAYELGLMEHVTPSQAWGVSAGVAPGSIIALKNGWLPISSGWTVNSVGWVEGAGRNYLIAVTTSGDPSMGYGIDSISEVSEAAWSALAH
jgi:hypothetical protein